MMRFVCVCFFMSFTFFVCCWRRLWSAVFTVKIPVPELIRRKPDQGGRHRGDIRGMLKRRIFTLGVEHPEEMPVQMLGVVHHRHRCVF